MSPVLLIEHSLRHGLDFTGRAGRAEYWWWILFSLLMTSGLYFVGLTVPQLDWLANAWAVFSFVIGISLTVRRLHDIDMTGKWYLVVPGAIVITLVLASIAPDATSHILFVPVVLVMIFYFLVGFGPGEAGDNRFGSRHPVRPVPSSDIQTPNT